MTREESINYLISSGFSEEQVKTIVKAFEPTTKNDLGVDCITRQSVLDKIQRLINAEQNNIDENGDYMNYARERVNAYEAIQFFVENDCLCPSVTPQEPRWIPVKFRPLTDEEQNKYPDCCYMADCPMPDDGEEILVCNAHGGVEKDECGFDDGFYLDSGYDWKTDIVAWMPLPEPYKVEPQKSEGQA